MLPIADTVKRSTKSRSVYLRIGKIKVRLSDHWNGQYYPNNLIINERTNMDKIDLQLIRIMKGR